MLFWLLPDGRWFSTALIAGFTLALVGVFQSRRPALFLLPFTGLLIGAGTYAAWFVVRGDLVLGLFFFLILWGPSLLATPWFVAQLHALWRAARGTPPRASA